MVIVKTTIRSFGAEDKNTMAMLLNILTKWSTAKFQASSTAIIITVRIDTLQK